MSKNIDNIRKQVADTKAMVKLVVADSALTVQSKVNALRKIEVQHYKPLIRDIAYTKNLEEQAELAKILEDVGSLTTKLGWYSNNISEKMHYYTDAAILYNYVISIINDKLDKQHKNTEYNIKLDGLYSKLTQIKQAIISVAIQSIQDNEYDGNTTTPAKLPFSTISMVFQDSNAASLARINPIKSVISAHKTILTNLRDHVGIQLYEIEKYRIRSQEADNFKEKAEWQELYVEDTRLLFEYIATRLKGFLAGLYQEAEVELQQAGITKPCDYTVMGLGSLALNQATPYSDLEFAILLEHEGQSKEEGERIKEYFRNLTYLVHFKVINLGETTIPISKYGLDLDHLVHRGVNFDLGGKTPLGRIERDKDYDLIQTVEVMLQYLKGSINCDDQFLAHIIENVCYIGGNIHLIIWYQAQVKSFMYSRVNQDDHGSLFNYEAIALTTLKDIAHKSTLKGDIDQLDPNLSASQKAYRLFNVKPEIYRLLDRLIYNLGMYYGIRGESAWDTINKLESLEIIRPEASNHLRYATTLATTLRLKTYLHYKAQQENLSVFGISLENQQEINKYVSKIFHLTLEDLSEDGCLFRYFYTAIEIHKKLEEFCEEHATLKLEERASFFKECDFYSESAANKGLIYYRLGQYKAAQRHLESAQNDPNNLQDNLYLKHALASIYKSFGLKDKAIIAWEDCIKLCELYSNTKIDSKCKINIATFHDNIGTIYNTQGKYSEAIAHHLESLAMRQNIYTNKSNSELKVDHAHIAASLSNLGSTYYNQGKFEEARDYHTQSLEMSERLNPHWHQFPNPDIADSLNNLGNVARKQKRYDDALEKYTQSLHMREVIAHHEPHPDTAVSLNNIGLVYTDKNNYPQALKYLKQGYEMRNKIYADRHQTSQDVCHPSIVASLINIGNVYFKNKEFDEAIPYYINSLRIAKMLYIDELHSTHPDIAACLYSLGNSYYYKQDYNLAINWHSQSLEMMQKIHTQPQAEIALSFHKLGLSYYEIENNDKSVWYCIKARQVIADFPKHPYTKSIIETLIKTSEIFSNYHLLTTDYIIMQILYSLKSRIDFTDFSKHYEKALSLQQIIKPDLSNLKTIVEEYKLALIFMSLDDSIDLTRAQIIKMNIYSNVAKLTETNCTSIELWLNVGINKYDTDYITTLITSPTVEINISILGITALIQAVVRGDENIVRALIQAGADINIPNKEGATPLYCSIGYYNQPINLKIVELLLQNRADPNMPMNDGDTPMHMAHYRANIDAIKLLLQYRANINTQNHIGKTPLHCLLEKAGIAAEDKIKVIEKFLPQYNLTLQDQKNKTVIEYSVIHCPEVLTSLLNITNAEDIDCSLVEPYMLLGYSAEHYISSDNMN